MRLLTDFSRNLTGSKHLTSTPESLDLPIEEVELESGLLPTDETRSNEEENLNSNRAKVIRAKLMPKSSSFSRPLLSEVGGFETYQKVKNRI